jgi:hypothetical protein
MNILILHSLLGSTLISLYTHLLQPVPKLSEIAPLPPNENTVCAEKKEFTACLSPVCVQRSHDFDRIYIGCVPNNILYLKVPLKAGFITL